MDFPAETLTSHRNSSKFWHKKAIEPGLKEHMVPAKNIFIIVENMFCL